MSYLVCYLCPEEGEVNKIVKACPQTLLEESKKAFGVKGESFALELYNEQYKVYVRIDGTQDLIGKEQGRLRMVRTSATASMRSAGSDAEVILTRSFSTATTVTPPKHILPTLGPDSPSGIIFLESLGEGTASYAEVLNSTAVDARAGDGGDGCRESSEDTRSVDGLNSTGASKSSTDAGISSAGASNSSTRRIGDAVGVSRGWFAPTRLSRRVQDLLARKERFEAKDWSEVMELVFATYTQEQESNEPSRSDYGKIAGAILTEFPHLRGHLAVDEAMKWVKRMVSNKFKNKRRYSSKDSCPSATGKRPSCSATGKRPSHGSTGGDKKRQKIEGFPNYAPEVSKSEFDVEVDKNKLRNGGGDDVNRLMDDTFAARRRAIVDEHVAVADLKEDYAPLFTEAQFWRELERMSGREAFREWALAALEEWKKKIAAALKGSPETALKQAAAVMKEKWLGETSDPKDGSPYLQNAGDHFKIWVEGTPCYTFIGTDEAVLGFVLVHSVLNCAFTRKYRALGSVVQRYVLGIRDGVPAPEKAMSFVQRLA